MKVKKLKYAVGTWQYGPLGDRFVPGGYQEPAGFPALLDHIAIEVPSWLFTQGGCE